MKKCYRIKCAQNDKYLTYDNLKVVLSEKKDNNNQLWNIVINDNSYYDIFSEENGNLINIEGNNSKFIFELPKKYELYINYFFIENPGKYPCLSCSGLIEHRKIEQRKMNDKVLEMLGIKKRH